MKVQTVGDYLNGVVKKQKSGEVWLDVLQKQFPQLPRAELIRQARESKDGQLIIGRRGAKSRFVFGDALTAQKTHTPSVSRTQTTVAHTGTAKRQTSLSTGALNLRFRIGDTEIATLPVDLDLVPS
jgi:hypothetical protein